LQGIDRSLAESPSYKPTILISATSFRGPKVAPKTSGSGDAAALVPANRWDVDIGWFEHTTPNKRFGSFIEGAELFDNVFFGISGQEATAMDAQQRLALEGSWEALRASVRASSLQGDALQSVAVSVGISYNEYYLNTAYQGMTAYTATSGTLSVVCGRISFTLGLKGPSLSIDTACSSSLVGAHLAATSFIPGGCPRALVCGVNLTIRAETTAVLSKAGMLTADGRCKTLDASANGYMRGEACVVHLLEAANEDEDEEEEGSAGRKQPLAILAGTGVNQDGRASSLTAPNGPAQQAVIRAALTAATGVVLPHQISILEMHGTGTALGDPIEIGAAFAVLQNGEGRPLELQAAKSRVLHTEPAAGAVGLANLVLRLRKEGAHETLHLRNINPHVGSIFNSQTGKKDYRGWAVARQPTPATQT
jgi:acyl transferase domain-containing protein